MESFPVPYPLVFFDGEQEQAKGYVDINSVLTFKRFQSLLSQKMGQPPNQLLAEYMCRRIINDKEKWVRFPITVNTNFNAFLNEHDRNKDRDSYFLISMKKPKRGRKASKKWIGERDPHDDWVLKCTTGGVGAGIGQNNEKLMLEEAAEKMFSKPFLSVSKGPVFEINNNSSAGKRIILKRPTFDAKGLLVEGLHASQFNIGNADMIDHIVQIQSQAYLNHGEYNWNASLMHEQSGVQNSYGYSSILPSVLASPRTKLEYHHHNSIQGFDPSFLPGELYNSTDGPLESICRDPYRSESIDWIYNVPKTNPSAGLYNDRALGADLDWPRKKVVQYPEILLSGMWQAMMNNSKTNINKGMDGHQHPLGPNSNGGISENYGNRNADAEQDLHCHVCVECKGRNVSPTPFHFCVKDVVTKGFQGPSPAGPIRRREEHNA